MRSLLKSAGVAGLILAGCGEGTAEQFSPVKQVTIVYKQDGMQKGSVTTRHESYAALRGEENDLALEMMGIKQETKDWVVYRDGYIYRGDPIKKKITKTKDPVYDQVKENIKGKDPMDVAMMFIGGMGATKNGEKGEFAEEVCDYFVSAQANMTFCMTEDGLMLYMKAGLGPAMVERTAISVDRSDGGGADFYTMPRPGYTMTEGPDINAIMQGFPGNN